MIGDLTAAVARAFCRLLLPLAAYYGVTVVIPLANGAAQSGAAFVQHTLVVLVVPLVVVVLAGSGAYVWGQVLNRCFTVRHGVRS